MTAKPNCSAIKQGKYYGRMLPIRSSFLVEVSLTTTRLVLLPPLTRISKSGAGEKYMLKCGFNNGSVSVSQCSTQVCCFFALQFHLSLVYSSMLKCCLGTRAVFI